MSQPAFNRSIKFKLRFKDGTERQIYSRDLRLAFSISKTMNEDLNTVRAKIYNLNPTSRAQICEVIDEIVIYFGYLGDGFDLLGSSNAEYDAKMFEAGSGDVTLGSSAMEGTDWVTSLTFRDGKKDSSQHFPKSYAPGTSIKKAMEDTIEQYKKANKTVLKTLIDEIKDSFKKTSAEDAEGSAGVSTFERGKAMVGRIGDELAKIAVPLGLDYSIQDGTPHFSIGGQPLEPQGAAAKVFSFSNGLLSTPERIEIYEARGQKLPGVRFKMMLVEYLLPHYRISLADQPDRQIVSVRMTGDSHSTNCSATIEARDLST